MQMILRCPNCQRELAFFPGQKQATCVQGHAFDVSREGYLNLLVSHHKSSKQPGDSKEMLLARREFLSTEAYAPVALKVAEFASRGLEIIKRSGLGKVQVLDIGCGEGYYMQRLQDALASQNKDGLCDLWGLDISKEAIRMATKRSISARFLVGSSFRLPFASEAIHLATSVFSPLQWDEVFRVLVPGGIVILVYPLADHLKTLKEEIYADKTRDKDYEKYLQAPAGFKVLDTDKIQYDFTIEKEVGPCLLKMTPHFWKIKPELREAAIENPQTDLNVSMGIVAYQKEDANEAT